MGEFYTKNSSGEFIPVDLEPVSVNNFQNKFVLVKIGKDGDSVSEDEIEEVIDGIQNSKALMGLPGVTYLIVSPHNIQFDVLGNIDEISEQYISIRVTEDDDISKLQSFQKQIKEQLKKKVKKVVILPMPITVKEYNEVLEIKQRCDIRRNRRGN